MSEKVKAYSYLRISSESQKIGDGIRRQMEASEKYAKDNGYELVETISDLGVSAFKGKNAKEGAFACFMDAIDDGTVSRGSVLIVESLDRLSRAKVLEAFSQFTSILTKGVTIVTLVDSQVYTDETVNQNPGQLFTSLGIMLRANDESETKSLRLREVWNKKRENAANQKMSKNAPAWLELSEDRSDFIIDEVKADTVRRIFDLYINGMGIFSVTRQLNRELKKYPPITNSKRWTESYIADIIHNTAVYGSFQPHRFVNGKRQPVGEPIADYYPAVITEDTFHLAQSKVKERTNTAFGRKGETFSNLFSTLLTCGKCGGSMTMKNKGKKPAVYKYLRCNNSLRGAGCTCPAWRYNEFEEAFYKFVREVNFAEVFSGDEAKTKVANLERQKAAKKVEIAKLQQSYDTLLERFENPNFPAELVDNLVLRSETIRTRIEDGRRDLEELEASVASVVAENVTEDQADFVAQYDALKTTKDADELRQIRFRMHSILKRTVDNIVIYNGETVEPWDAIDHISEKLGNELFARGINTEEKFQDYFRKPSGQRMYDKSERFFVVRFKNGVVRVVNPYLGVTHMSVNERLANLKRHGRKKVAL